MKPLLASLCLAATVARAQSGVLFKTLNVKARCLLLDPPSAALRRAAASDGVAVFDTDTNTLLSVLATGSYPADLSVSPSGTRATSRFRTCMISR